MMRSKPRGRLSASRPRRSGARPALIVAVCLLAAFQFGLPRFLDTRLSDARFVFGERPASGTIVLVDIYAASLSEVGVWPWPRRLHADLLTAAAEAGASRVAFDIDFSARSTAADDEALAEALGSAGPETFLAAFIQ